MNKNREKALEWWKKQEGNRYHIMSKHNDKILNVKDRDPSNLTGREIEILYDAEKSVSKDFKYVLKSKDGKILLESIVTFGSKEQPFPENWENDIFVQIALEEYKKTFIEENFDIEISEE